MDIGQILFSTSILTFLTLYPFYLKKHKKHKYRGLWEAVGELLKTPKIAASVPLAWFLANLIYLLLNG